MLSSESSTGLWIELIKWLADGHATSAGGRATYLGTNWQSLPHRERLAILEADEKAYSERVDHAVDAWLQKGRWPPFSAEERYQTQLRFAAVLMFLGYLTIGGQAPERSTILPFPEMNQAAVARWFLVDWWRDHGLELLCALLDPKQKQS